MPSPILFFIIIIVVDLILKSAKDKKKIEEARQSRPSQPPKPSKPRPFEDLRKILDEEMEKERQRQRRLRGENNQPKASRPTLEMEKSSRERQLKTERDLSPSRVENKRKVESKSADVESSENNIKRDLLMGIVFSEILSEPKSIQNQRRSL